MPPQQPLSTVPFGDDLFESVRAQDWSRALDLIRREAPVDHVSTRPGQVGESTLHVALRGRAPLSVVDPLLRRGADVNLADARWRAGLHAAAQAGGMDRERTALLLRWGGDVAAVDANGHTPLTLALRHGATAGAVAAIVHHDRRAVGYVQMKDPTWRSHTPLTVALRCGCGVDVVKVLLDAGASVDVRLEDGSGPLELAREYCTTDVVDLILAREGISLPPLPELTNTPPPLPHTTTTATMGTILGEGDDGRVPPRELPQAMLASFVKSMRENLSLTKAKLTKASSSPMDRTLHTAYLDDPDVYLSPSSTFATPLQVLRGLPQEEPVTDNAVHSDDDDDEGSA